MWRVKKNANSALLLLFISLFQVLSNVEVIGAVSEAPLAQQINVYLSEVTSWEDLVDIGVVMHKSALSDFDSWITTTSKTGDWVGVFAIKRYAEQGGYSSSIINATVKLALSSIPMFENYSLPITEYGDSKYFWPWNRYVLYGYRYAEELNWETGRWNITSGFLALKSVRDWYNRAFYRCNPDLPAAHSLFGTRWHQAGSLMDCFLIFYKLGVEDALNYAVQEWEWLNNTLWSDNHFSYSPSWSDWEFSGISVFPNVAKLRFEGKSLDNWTRVITDIQFRYIRSLWDSPQWHETDKVVEHHHPANPEQRVDGTLNAWIMLNTFYAYFNFQNKRNMKDMLEGNEVVQAWRGVNEFIEKRFPDSSAIFAQAALCLFLTGISPQAGRGLATPLISDKHSCYASLNYRHFEFDYTNQKIRIPVWGGTTLQFMYGTTATRKYFQTTGIYEITFTADWNSISQIQKVSNLYSDESYLWTQEDNKNQFPALLIAVIGTITGFGLTLIFLRKRKLASLHFSPLSNLA